MKEGREELEKQLKIIEELKIYIAEEKERLGRELFFFSECIGCAMNSVVNEFLKTKSAIL